MTRKPPAYARALRDLIYRREYPDYVVVYYGHDWKRRPQHVPSMCVGVDYAPFVYDWGVLAGLRVHVVIDCGAQHFALVAELAAVTAPVLVVPTGNAIDEPGQRRADEYLFTARGDATLAALWSAEIEADYLQREAEYYFAMAADRGVVAG